MLSGPTGHEFIGKKNKREEWFSCIFSNINHHIWLWNFSLLFLCCYYHLNIICPKELPEPAMIWMLGLETENCSEIDDFPPQKVLINDTVNLKFLQTSSEILNQCVGSPSQDPCDAEVWGIFVLVLFLSLPMFLQDSFFNASNLSPLLQHSCAFICFSCCLGRVSSAPSIALLKEVGAWDAAVPSDPLKFLLPNTQPFLPQSSFLLNSSKNCISFWAMVWFSSVQVSPRSLISSHETLLNFLSSVILRLSGFFFDTKGNSEFLDLWTLTCHVTQGSSWLAPQEFLNCGFIAR